MSPGADETGNELSGRPCRYVGRAWEEDVFVGFVHDAGPTSTGQRRAANEQPKRGTCLTNVGTLLDHSGPCWAIFGPAVGKTRQTRSVCHAFAGPSVLWFLWCVASSCLTGDHYGGIVRSSPALSYHRAVGQSKRSEVKRALRPPCYAYQKGKAARSLNLPHCSRTGNTLRCNALLGRGALSGKSRPSADAPRTLGRSLRSAANHQRSAGHAPRIFRHRDSNPGHSGESRVS